MDFMTIFLYIALASVAVLAYVSDQRVSALELRVSRLERFLDGVDLPNESNF